MRKRSVTGPLSVAISYSIGITCGAAASVTRAASAQVTPPAQTPPLATAPAQTPPPVETTPATPATPPTVVPPAQTIPGAPGPISVSVNGEPLVFPPGQGAIESGGRVLVPLRGIFERLGAQVKYDAPTQSIVAIKGDTNILLRVGGTTAVVNSVPRPLSAPAQLVGGVTVVPLRFVSEALGAKVKWSAPTRSIAIITSENVAAAEAAAAAALSAPAVGALSLIDAASPTPILTVHTATADTPIPLMAEARILTKRGDDPAVVAKLTDLKVGDQVSIRRDTQGRGYDVEADYVEQPGVIKTIAPGDNGITHVTLADDSTVDVAANAPVTLTGAAAALTDLKPRMPVTFRMNPATRIATAVAAQLPKVEVTSVTQSAGDKTLRADDDLTVTAVGTPGGMARCTVAGIPSLSDQMMTETPAMPGTYTAAFKIPPGFAVDKTPVTAVITLDTVTSPVGTSASTVTIDSQPPTFSDLVPVDGGTVPDRRPAVTGSYSDKGVGIDPTKTQILLNGVDVTAQAKVTNAFFLYQPPADLPPGSNKVTVTIKDLAGNVAQKDWTFSIIPTESPIKVVTIDAQLGHALGAGDTLKVRAEATPGGAAKFTIAGGVISGTMYESSPGIYTGSYLVQKGDSVTNAPVAVIYTPAGGAKDVTLTAVQTVTLAAGAPVPPVIDQPLEGASTGQYVTITGHGTPNTTVRLTIQYAGKFLILKQAGSVTSMDVKVGMDGTWTTGLLTLETPHQDSNIQFTAQAVTVASDAETSSPAIVHFSR